MVGDVKDEDIPQMTKWIFISLDNDMAALILWLYANVEFQLVYSCMAAEIGAARLWLRTDEDVELVKTNWRWIE
jgi:hypothetical protein